MPKVIKYPAQTAFLYIHLLHIYVLNKIPTEHLFYHNVVVFQVQTAQKYCYG